MGWLIRHGRNTFLSNIAFIIFPFLKTFMATLLEDENWTSLNIQLNRSAQESPVIIQISFRYTKSRLKRKSFRRLFFYLKGNRKWKITNRFARPERANDVSMRFHYSFSMLQIGCFLSQISPFSLHKCSGFSAKHPLYYSCNPKLRQLTQPFVADWIQTRWPPSVDKSHET